MVHIVGDIYINHKIYSLEPKADDVIVICGDFASVWQGDATNAGGLAWLESLPCTVLFLGGSDERLSSFESEPKETLFGAQLRKVSDNIYFVPTGSKLTIDSRSYFFIGGGFDGSDEITRDERDLICDTVERSDNCFDCVISYLAPAGVLQYSAPEWIEGFPKAAQPQNKAGMRSHFMRALAEKMVYERWYCSSVHIDAFSRQLNVMGVAEEIHSIRSYCEQKSIDELLGEVAKLFPDTDVCVQPKSDGAFGDTARHYIHISSDETPLEPKPVRKPARKTSTKGEYYARRRPLGDSIIDIFGGDKKSRVLNFLFGNIGFGTYLLTLAVSTMLVFLLMIPDFWEHAGNIGEGIAYMNFAKRFSSGTVWMPWVFISSIFALIGAPAIRCNMMTALECCWLLFFGVAALGMQSGADCPTVLNSFYMFLSAFGVSICWSIFYPELQNENYLQAAIRRMMHCFSLALPLACCISEPALHYIY